MGICMTHQEFLLFALANLAENFEMEIHPRGLIKFNVTYPDYLVETLRDQSFNVRLHSKNSIMSLISEIQDFKLFTENTSHIEFIEKAKKHAGHSDVRLGINIDIWNLYYYDQKLKKYIEYEEK